MFETTQFGILSLWSGLVENEVNSIHFYSRYIFFDKFGIDLEELGAFPNACLRIREPQPLHQFQDSILPADAEKRDHLF